MGVDSPWAIMVSLLFLPLPVLAQHTPTGSGSAPPSGLRSQVDIAGSLRSSYWSASRSLDEKTHLAGAALWLRGRWQPHPNLAIVGDGWAMNNEVFVDPDATTGALREGYVDLRLGALDMRVGRQIIAWGRADRINPTDNLTPRNLTLLVPNDADQRTGTVGAVGTYHLGNTSLVGVWLPVYEPHTIPLSAPSNGSIVRARRIPRAPVSQFGLKVDRTAGRADWSLSFYDGIDLYPDLQLEAVEPARIQVAQTYHRIRVVGADAATTAGAYGVRGEVAYTFTERNTTSTIKSPFLLMVLGADRTFADGIYANVQYVLRVVSDYRDPRSVADPVRRAVALEQAALNNQFDRIQHTVTVPVNKKWLNDALETEVASVLGLGRVDYAVRLKTRYAVTDHWRATVGADIFRGPAMSFFGRIRDMSSGYVEIRWDY